MLFSKNRLKDKRIINSIFRRGKVIAGKFVLIKFLKTSLGDIHFAIIAGKKVSSSAVARNKIKRQIRAAIRKNLFKIKVNTDFLVIAKKEITHTNYDEIEKSLSILFEKLN
jgi:ribonuclease P protein component